MNAAVLVSHVAENGTYEGSAERLADFWEYLCADSMIESNPFFKSWWDFWRFITQDFVTGEAARRFHSTREFATSLYAITRQEVSSSLEDLVPI